MADVSDGSAKISVSINELFGTGIQSVEQTRTSEESGGTNEITVTLTNGQQSKFYIKNGKDGYSPSITIEQGAEGYSITVTDEEGSHEYSIIVDSTLDAESANPIQNQAVAGAVTQLTSDITAEVTRATNAETAIRTEASQIYATKAALQSEENARSLADTSLSNDIDAETQRATQAEASIRLAIPNKTSQLTNDSGFLTQAPVQSVNGQTGAVTIPTATTSANGLMSSQDKVNLDAVRGQIGDLKNAVSSFAEYVESSNFADPKQFLLGYNLSGTGNVTYTGNKAYSVSPEFTLEAGKTIYIYKFRKFLVQSPTNQQLLWVDANTTNYLYTATQDCKYRLQFFTGDGLYVSYSSEVPLSTEPYFNPFYQFVGEFRTFTEGIAHQGYNKDAPNGTMSAYIAAYKHGFHIVEADVNYTSDNVLICCHNDVVYADDVNKIINPTLTAAAGNYNTAITIADTPLATLQEYSWGAWKAADYADETVLLFDDLVKYCKQHGLKLYIDHAYQAIGDETRRVALFNIIDKYGMGDYVIFVTGNPVIFDWHNDASAIISGPSYTQEMLNQAITLKTNRPEATVGLSLPQAIITDSISLEVHQNGLLLYAFTVDKADRFVELMPYCDAIFSNLLTTQDAVNIYENS